MLLFWKFNEFSKMIIADRRFYDQSILGSNAISTPKSKPPAYFRAFIDGRNGRIAAGSEDPPLTRRGFRDFVHQQRVRLRQQVIPRRFRLPDVFDLPD